MPLPDFSHRDDAVRHHTYASVRRRDGLPHDLFARYWRDVHGPLCARLPGLGYYVQQHFDRDRTANLWPIADGVRRMTAVLDGSAEIGFASLQDQAAFAEAGAILYADEANFIGEAVAYNLPRGSRTVVDREPNPAHNGPDVFHRLHVYMARRPDAGSDAWLTDSFAAFAAEGVVQKVKLHLPEAYSNDRPAPPSPNVAHTVDEDRLNLAVAEIAFESARVAREFFATGLFRRTMAGQATYLTAVGAFLVTGVYTYVRDGKPTTAGLRGSSQAELIEAVGAANQLDRGVSALFVRG
jgi:hypothetical protein